MRPHHPRLPGVLLCTPIGTAAVCWAQDTAPQGSVLLPSEAGR